MLSTLGELQELQELEVVKPKALGISISPKALEASVSEKVSGASVSEKVSGASVSEKVSGASVSEKVSGASVSEKVSGASVSEKVSGASVSEKVSRASVSEKVSGASVSEKVSGASVSEKVSGASVSEKVSGASVSEKVSRASVSEKVSRASVSEKVSRASVSEKVSRASVSEKVSRASVSAKVSGASIAARPHQDVLSVPQQKIEAIIQKTYEQHSELRKVVRNQATKIIHPSGDEAVQIYKGPEYTAKDLRTRRERIFLLGQHKKDGRNIWVEVDTGSKATGKLKKKAGPSPGNGDASTAQEDASPSPRNGDASTVQEEDASPPKGRPPDTDKAHKLQKEVEQLLEQQTLLKQKRTLLLRQPQGYDATVKEDYDLKKLQEMEELLRQKPEDLTPGDQRWITEQLEQWLIPEEKQRIITKLENYIQEQKTQMDELRAQIDDLSAQRSQLFTQKRELFAQKIKLEAEIENKQIEIKAKKSKRDANLGERDANLRELNAKLYAKKEELEYQLNQLDAQVDAQIEGLIQKLYPQRQELTAQIGEATYYSNILTLKSQRLSIRQQQDLIALYQHEITLGLQQQKLENIVDEALRQLQRTDALLQQEEERLTSQQLIVLREQQAVLKQITEQSIPKIIDEIATDRIAQDIPQEIWDKQRQLVRLVKSTQDRIGSLESIQDRTAPHGDTVTAKTPTAERSVQPSVSHLEPEEFGRQPRLLSSETADSSATATEELKPRTTRSDYTLETVETATEPYPKTLVPESTPLPEAFYHPPAGVDTAGASKPTPSSSSSSSPPTAPDELKLKLQELEELAEKLKQLAAPEPEEFGRQPRLLSSETADSSATETDELKLKLQELNELAEELKHLASPEPDELKLKLQELDKLAEELKLKLQELDELAEELKPLAAPEPEEFGRQPRLLSSETADSSATATDELKPRTKMSDYTLETVETATELYPKTLIPKSTPLPEAFYHPPAGVDIAGASKPTLSSSPSSSPPTAPTAPKDTITLTAKVGADTTDAAKIKELSPSSTDSLPHSVEIRKASDEILDTGDTLDEGDVVKSKPLAETPESGPLVVSARYGAEVESAEAGEIERLFAIQQQFSIQQPFSMTHTPQQYATYYIPGIPDATINELFKKNLYQMNIRELKILETIILEKRRFLESGHHLHLKQFSDLQVTRQQALDQLFAFNQAIIKRRIQILLSEHVNFVEGKLNNQQLQTAVDDLFFKLYHMSAEELLQEKQRILQEIERLKSSPFTEAWAKKRSLEYRAHAVLEIESMLFGRGASRKALLDRDLSRTSSTMMSDLTHDSVSENLLRSSSLAHDLAPDLVTEFVLNRTPDLAPDLVFEPRYSSLRPESNYDDVRRILSRKMENIKGGQSTELVALKARRDTYTNRYIKELLVNADHLDPLNFLESIPFSLEGNSYSSSSFIEVSPRAQIHFAKLGFDSLNYQELEELSGVIHKRLTTLKVFKNRLEV